ncbi:MAG: anthranilate phosphoribosyltransferase [Campylobacteraceae bacterium]|jgi:anthranilate phosphoribosyltransferase|nr:anthranilate phosphoribosyltransferase [Campylobacteraceae bacterium]MBT7117015.1 anthranilate phosphoribosyltransferase [Campylobacteraceae bacterium]
MSNKIDTQIQEDFENIFSNTWDVETSKQYLVDMYTNGETAQQIAAAASVMREHSIKLPINDENLKTQLVDNCGTGGDKSNSFNVSTTVSILLSACGCKVAKHGNRSITSKSGSADMLEALGVNLDLDIDSQVKMLEQTGFVFMFAVNHHPAMKYIMPIRKSLDHRTIFNILGPLTNPADVQKQLIGVFDKSFVPKIAQALKLIDTKKALVVSAADGMDEISISDITYATSLEDGMLKDFIIDPREFGLSLYDKKDIEGGDAIQNSLTTKDILSGKIQGAKLDIVLINTAAALWVDGKVENIKDGISMALKVIKNGNAIKKLEEIITVSNDI